MPTLSMKLAHSESCFSAGREAVCSHCPRIGDMSDTRLIRSWSYRYFQQATVCLACIASWPISLVVCALSVEVTQAQQAGRFSSPGPL